MVSTDFVYEEDRIKELKPKIKEREVEIKLFKKEINYLSILQIT